MTYPIPRCDYEFCEGHLGKFQSCRDEALYEMTLDGFYESTGDVEYRGYFTILTLDEGESVSLGEGWVEIPPGTYVVESTNSGAIYVSEGPADEMRKAFDEEDTLYGKWIDDDDEEES